MMISDQEKPVPSPSHIAVYFAVPWYLDCHIRSAAITGNVIDRYLAAFVKDRAHRSDWRLDPVLAGRNLHHVRQRGDQPDGPVTTHTQITDVIEEDNAGGAGAVGRLAEQPPHHDIGTPRLVHHGRTKIVVPSAKAFQPVGQCTRS
jgi:hypothetical protein